MDMLIRGYSNGHKFIFSIEYNLGLFIARCAHNTDNRYDCLVIVTKEAPNGALWLT